MIISVDLSTKTGTKLAAEALKFSAGVTDDEDEDEEAAQQGKKAPKKGRGKSIQQKSRRVCRQNRRLCALQSYNNEFKRNK